MLRRLALRPRYPTVADPGFRQDQSWGGRLVAELAAQRPDVDTEVVALLPVADTPDATEEPLVREQLARVGRKSLEQRVLGLREVHALAAGHHQLAPEVDLEAVEHEDGRRSLARLAPTDRRPQPREDFFHAERLRHVVVGAGIECI